jgi:hypothetical protein
MEKEGCRLEISFTGAGMPVEKFADDVIPATAEMVPVTVAWDVNETIKGPVDILELAIGV